MTYVGLMEFYGKGVEVLEKLAWVIVNEAHLYRVTDTYGGLESDIKEQETILKSESKTDTWPHKTKPICCICR